MEIDLHLSKKKKKEIDLQNGLLPGVRTMDDQRPHDPSDQQTRCLFFLEV